jgi:hypothetical protein
MYFNDHNPSHFHAKYSGYEALFALAGSILEGELHGPVFEAQKDIAFFRKLSVELETVVWPNGSDLAPEFVNRLQNKQN